MKRPLLTAAIVLSVLLMASCATTSFEGPLQIGGQWTYTLNDTHGNVYDTGTIRFEGADPEGTWVQKNYYEYEYTGTWQVNGVAVTITGAEIWKGKAVGPDRLEGTWTKDNGDSGVWHAVR